MESIEKILTEQKVRFLACEILFKGSPQTFEEVCQNCRLFTVTTDELLSFTFMPIKFGNCLAPALFIPFPGSLYVTQAYCQEIGRKSILTPFSLYQNQGGKWLRNVAPVLPALSGLEKWNVASKEVTGESIRCQALNVDRETPALSPPPLGVPYVSQSPKGEAVLTNASSTDRETAAPSNVSYRPVNGGSVLPHARKVDEAATLIASTPRGSVEFSTCPSKCDSASSRRPTKGGVVYQAEELGHQGLLWRNENGISSSCPLQKADGVTPVLGHLVVSEKSAPRRGRRPRVAPKVETRSKVSKEVESESAKKSGLSSCVTRSAAAQLPRRGLENAQKKRERNDFETTGEKEAPGNSIRGRRKAIPSPASVKDEMVEVEFAIPTQHSIPRVDRPVIKGFEQSDVVGETTACPSGSEISGAVDVEILPLKIEAELRPKLERRRRKLIPLLRKRTRKASMQSSRAKGVTVILSSPEVTSPTSGRLSGNPEYESLPVMGGAFHLEVDGETRISSSGAAELQLPANVITTEQFLPGKSNHMDSSPDLGVGRDAGVFCRNRESYDPQKLTSLDVDDLLYCPDSEESLDTPERARARGGVEPQALPPRLSPALLAAGRRSLGIQRVQLQTVRSLDYEVNHPMAEEAPEIEVVARTGTLEHLSCIHKLLREMNTIITSSAAEHIEDVCTTGPFHCDGDNMNVTASGVEHCASFPCAEVPEGANLDLHVGGYFESGDRSSRKEKWSVVEVEHCGKSHMSMISECVHYDDDDNAAVVENSPLMPVNNCEVLCNVGEDTVTTLDTVICVDPGEEATDVIDPVMLDTEVNGPGTSGATAVEKRHVSGVKLLKYDLNGEHLVTGTEFREEQVEPFAHYRPGCGNTDKEDYPVRAETVPSVEAHMQLEGVGFISQKMEDTEEEAVSIEESETSSHSILERAPTVKAEQFREGLPIEVDMVNSRSVKNTSALVHVGPALMTDHIQRVEDVNPSRTTVLMESNATSQTVAIMNGAEIGAHTNSEVGAEKSAVQVEDCANLLSLEFDNVTAFRVLDNTGKNSTLGKELPISGSEAPVDATIEGTRDGKSEKKLGPSLVGNAEEPRSKELPAVEKIAPANLIKIIDHQSKQKNQELKIVPEFDDYTVVGEEGSGGYGTVYRVRHNATKDIYAMKCPLMKTHSSCVDNEISMLQQLGGKECVIKFERVVPGRFRTQSDSGDKLSECKSILLEFMEHDKPEVLKKEITVEELRNYCVCLFTALAHMHRRRIMHLDVKPGNFLFSRTKKRGYLVDFNLARDEQKHPKRIKKVLPSSAHIVSRIDSTRRSAKRPPVQDVASTPVSFSKRSRLLIGASGTQLSFGTPSPSKPLPTVQDQNNKNVAHGVSADTRVSSPRLPDLAQSRSTTPMGAHSSPLRPVASPKPRNEHPDLGSRRQPEVPANVQENPTLGPRPQSGHRAILKYIQTNVYKQQPSVLNQQQSSLPASQRKRVAAVQSKKRPLADGSFKEIQHTLPPSVARRLKPPAKLKGFNDQVVKDGPCVGTKGYRAPEVLLRSLKQTIKVDIWSAGVSLLQLVSGRSPFSSTSTDGALKDIAKVRGSDKVLALATRHQRQHSISKELCAMRYPPITLKEWCEKHSRRPELKGRVPPELYDLLERCLDVDPVSRITAEEALRHQFCSIPDEVS